MATRKMMLKPTTTTTIVTTTMMIIRKMTTTAITTLTTTKMTTTTTMKSMLRASLCVNQPNNLILYCIIVSPPLPPPLPTPPTSSREEIMTTGRRQRFSRALLMLAILSSSSSLSSLSSSSLLVEAKVQCDSSGCCHEANYGPGPLNMSPPAGGFDAGDEDAMIYIYHCVRYFNHFEWFRLLPNDNSSSSSSSGHNTSASVWIPYPWGQAGRVSYIPGRLDNQTVVIPRLRTDDEGVYRFVASNGTHEVTGEFYLQVQCLEPPRSFATKLQRFQPVPLGASRTLKCALNPPLCPESFFVSIFWVWRNSSSGHSRILKNETFETVDVLCDLYSESCEVIIHEVIEELYHVEFVCLLEDGGNQTVQLVRVGTDVKTWLPYVVAVAGSIVLLTFVVTITWWQCRRRLAFWCRGQTSGETIDADVAVLHGDDHDTLVRQRLLPQLEHLGYRVRKETTPGRANLPDQLQAVEKSHSVILTFSEQELAEDGQVDFLIKYVYDRKTRFTVAFIRCEDDLTPPTPRKHASNGSLETSSPEENTLNGNHHSSNQDTVGTGTSKVWRKEEMKAFKILNLPRSLHSHNSLGTNENDTKDVEKFWYSLKKSLPKTASSSQSSPNRAPKVQQRTGGRNSSSAESRRPLINSVERSSGMANGCGTFPSSRRDTDVEAGRTEVETAPLLHPQPHTTSILDMGSNPQPSATPENDSIDDEVFEDPAGNSWNPAPISGHGGYTVNSTQLDYPQAGSGQKDTLKTTAKDPQGSPHKTETSPQTYAQPPIYVLEQEEKFQQFSSNVAHPREHALRKAEASQQSTYDPRQGSLGTTRVVQESDETSGTGPPITKCDPLVITRKGQEHDETADTGLTSSPTSHPGRRGLITRGEAQEKDGTSGTGSGEGRKQSGGSNAFLESQESGYHSPSSQGEVAFVQ